MTDGNDQPHRWLPDAFGIAWVIIAGWAVLIPALVHGLSLGPFDQLYKLGLTAKATETFQVHNPQIVDLIREIIPWTTMSWSQVHSGMVPLWNPYSSLGAPLAFNWQSATFSLPALLGYLVPVRYDFTLQVFVTMMVGGTGVYLLGRVLRLGVLGAAMAATGFELSGAFMATLGWPIASVVSWSGWLFALTILIMRGQHRRRYVTLLAVIIALSLYAGEPDTLLVVVAALVVFVVVMLVCFKPKHRPVGSTGRNLLDLALASLAGLGLAAPLVLPAAQLTFGSVRGTGHLTAFPAYQTLHLVFQTFDGSSVAPLVTFNNHIATYVAPAAYIGVIPVVLALMGAVRRRLQPAIIALVAVFAMAVVMVYLSPLVSFLNGLPGLGTIRWVRAIQILLFVVAVLAGVGLDVVARSGGDRGVRRWLGASFGTAAMLLLLLWLFGRSHLPAIETRIRAKSFIWPASELAVGLAVFGILMLFSRPRVRDRVQRLPSLVRDPGRIAAVILLVSSTGFLIDLGASWFSSSPTYLAPNSSEVALQKAVGTSMVGFGTLSCWYPPTLGIQPDVNIVYGVHEFDSYDPLTPQGLYTSWQYSTDTLARPIGGNWSRLPFSLFCPVVRTTSQARLYGIGFVLEPEGQPGPTGSVFDKRIGEEDLYRIPGASAATITPLTAHRAIPAVDAPGQPVKVTYPSPTSWKLVTHASTPQMLRLRLTDVPGWHASIDGKPLQLNRFDRIMLQARISAGTHTIELHYWPDYFNAGIALGLATLLAIVLAHVVFRRRDRRATSSR
jgi:hypothetical protein